MRIVSTLRLLALGLFLLIPLFAFSQGAESFRGSIPEVLLRPARGEAPRYPIDLVIGELGRGSASSGAFSFANSVAANIIAGRMEYPALRAINPESFRIGGGRDEADGAVSFLIRFIGREQGITGEMYIRFVTRQIQENEGEIRTAGNWVFEELLLEEARYREIENQESASERSRFDLNPYERFF